MKTLYTVLTTGKINYAGGITGPMTTPTNLPLDEVISMVRKGYEVYQHNPVNLNEKVKVTIKNVGNITFKSTRSSVVKENLKNKPFTVPVVKKDENNNNNNKQNNYNKNHDKHQDNNEKLTNDFVK